MNTYLKAAVASVGALVCLLVTASAAVAHDPIFITEDQKTPDTGPYMPDGSISWALYGSVLESGDTRGFEFDLRDGDELLVSMLIPNLSPEVDLPEDELFTVEVTRPDGSVIAMSPETRDIFDEPFSKTSYVTLNEVREPGQAGRYTGIVTGNAPARFSVAIGITEIFFTETERSGDRPSNFQEISKPLGVWYATPPGEEPNIDALAEGEAEIDLDMVEEAMDEGEAEAPDGALDGDAPAEIDEATDEAGGEVAAAEVAAPAAADDGGSSTAWVAPVALLIIAVLGVGLFLFRGRAVS